MVAVGVQLTGRAFSWRPFFLGSDLTSVSSIGTRGLLILQMAYDFYTIEPHCRFQIPLDAFSPNVPSIDVDTSDVMDDKNQIEENGHLWFNSAEES